jgi:uncharacterized protein with HEPN domain
MLDHAREALDMIHGKSRKELDNERILQLALVRLVEIIGEAASKVTPEYRSKHPEVPWREIVVTRNTLIQDYDMVDLDILWNTVHEDLPSLIQKLQNILE